MGRARARWEALRASVDVRNAVRPPQPVAVYDRTAIVLGRKQETMAPVTLSERARLEHAHVIGTTGGGKTKFLELCIRQDIKRGRGVCVVDPHGEHPDSLYRSLLGWLDQKGYTKGGRNERPIHLIDPNAPTHTVGFNPLARPDAETDLSVIAGVTLEAFSRAWGGEDTTHKPTIERVLTVTFTALADLGLTLAEAPLLYDRTDRHGLRAWAIANVRDRYAREELQRLHELSLDERRRHDFDLEVLGPINRIARFVRPAAIRTMIGQTDRVLDVGRALDEGHIILANLSGGSRVYERDADLLGRLLTRSLFFHAKRRRAPERPFFVYLDECHRYLSGDLENLLAEVRKYGMGIVLSHQWLAQLETEGENMLAAVRNATNLKVVFRLKDPVEAEDLAHMVVPLDLEMPVRPLIKPTVVGHRRIKLNSESTTEQQATTAMRTETRGTTEGEAYSYVESFAETFAEGESSAESDALSIGEGMSRAALSGIGSGATSTTTMIPNTAAFGAPTVIGTTQGEGNTSHSSHGTGSSSTKGRTTGSTRGKSSMHAVTVGSAIGESVSFARHHSSAVGQGETRGTARSHGTQEGLEPVMEDRPSAVHGKDNMLYMAAQTLRNLTTGHAFINFVDATGMKPALLKVPDVKSYAPNAAAFDALRQSILDTSPSASRADQARAHLAERERALLSEARVPQAQLEPDNPAGFRHKKKRAPKEAKGKS